MRLTARTLAGVAVAALAACAVGENVRLLSYNIQGYNAPDSASWEALVRIVESRPADILLIQEAWDNAGRDAFVAHVAPDFPHIILGPADGGGNRQHIFSRFPLVNVAAIFAGGFSRPSLRVDVDSDADNPGAEFRLYNVHFKAGNSGSDEDLRVAMAERIALDVAAVQSVDPDFRIIFAGDVNEEPGDPALSLLHRPNLPLNLVNKVDPFTGSDVTRPASGRNLDHLVISDTVSAVITTKYIYNTDTFFPLPPPALPGDSETASDHLTIVFEFDLIRFRPGDVNADGAVDAFDIEPFAQAVFDPDGFRDAWPHVDVLEVADINGDGAVDAFDIEPFVDLLFGP